VSNRCNLTERRDRRIPITILQFGPLARNEGNTCRFNAGDWTILWGAGRSNSATSVPRRPSHVFPCNRKKTGARESSGIPSSQTKYPFATH